jgi:hypothetical protein
MGLGRWALLSSGGVTLCRGVDGHLLLERKYVATDELAIKNIDAALDAYLVERSKEMVLMVKALNAERRKKKEIEAMMANAIALKG